MLFDVPRDFRDTLIVQTILFNSVFPFAFVKYLELHQNIFKAIQELHVRPFQSIYLDLTKSSR